MRVTKTALSALRSMKIWMFVETADQVVKPQPAIDFMKQLTRLWTAATSSPAAVHVEKACNSSLYKQFKRRYYVVDQFSPDTAEWLNGFKIHE